MDFTPLPENQLNDAIKDAMAEWDLAIEGYQEELSKLDSVGWRFISQITISRSRIVNGLQKLIHKKDFQRLEYYRDETGSPVNWRDVVVEGKSVEDLTFKNLTIRGIVFERCKFGRLKIDTCTIFGLRLKGCSFKTLIIKDAHVKNACQLNEVRIACEFRVNNTIFDSDVTMNNSSIGEVTVLNKCEFNYNFRARNCIFKRDFSMTDCKCVLEVNFNNSVFHGNCNYHRTTFMRTTYLLYCLFSIPPQFFNSTLNSLTFLTGSKFRRCDRNDDAEAFRTLRAHFSTVKDHEQESKFFALQQRAHRKSTIYTAKYIWLAILMFLHLIDNEYYTYYQKQFLNLAPKDWKNKSIFMLKNFGSLTVLISYLYDEISEYGENVSRAAAWIIVLFSFCYAGYALSNGVSTNTLSNNFFSKLDPSVGYLIQNIYNPLSAFSEKAIFFATNKMSFIIYMIQSVMELIFTGLLLLAVRRKFTKGSSD